jgi:DNA-binding SARP family transcriptional activator
MDPRCRVELLGRLRVTQGERKITRFRTQKTGALLGYLAYHLERTHPREVLVELLWPGTSPLAGYQSLRGALSSLRRQLEPPNIPSGTVIQADRFSVRLNPDAVVTDVAEFAAVQRSAAEAAGDMERAEFLNEAVELYRGELLPGYYQDWIIPEQRRLAELFFSTVRWLTVYFEQAGEWERALECARRGVGADPLREEAHQELVRLLAASGQPAEAMHQYQELERILREELGTAPSAATRELVRQIRLRVEERGRVAVPRLPTAPVSPLPTGTVTFLLTDIERAKPLEEQGGPARVPAAPVRGRAPGARALEETNELLRKAFRRHGGQEVREAGGAFTVAFAHPSEALSCAVECQRALAHQSWPAEVGSLRVRMALHTREVKPREDESPGWLLRLGTQLLLAAHGGQILCSESSAALLRRSLPADVELTDLGYYRLRGLEGAERLFVVTYPGMEPKAVPAPNASPAYTSNLPIQLTAFFGREEELVRLEELLLDEERRLVTLTGPGGSGKTRLALEAAGHVFEAFRGAVWSVELQALSQAAFILPAVLGALRLPPLPEVEPMEQLVTALSRQRSLLVLDNFEHLVEEGAQVVHDLLERVPTLTCLVTSRRLLEVTGEREFFVGPLPVPSGGRESGGTGTLGQRTTVRGPGASR